MEYRLLDITVISAEGLKDVNLMSKMDVYVVVSIADDPSTKRQTHVDKDGGKTPKWNHRLKFSVDTSTLTRNPNLPLIFRLKSKRPFGDKDIGEVAVPIKELLDNDNSVASGGVERVIDYQVHTLSGKPKGTLKFSYKFGEKFMAPVEVAPAKAQKSYEPVTAYPTPAQAGTSTAYPLPPQGVAYAQTPYTAYPPPQAGYGYPPPPPGYGGGYPPAPAYGYPPQQGYGYPPVVQQPKKKKGNFGLGLGAGLLGGLLVGDMISDVGDAGAYDAGYDTGFDDGGGFDF